MLKFIKHNMETIAGIELFPMISFIIFFGFFIFTLVWVMKIDKKYIEEVESIPLD
jgi:cytochrome c oxidase cbb3-type subunit 4